MALSLSNFLYWSSAFLSLSSLASAKIVSYELNATWVRASPDGFDRTVIGINGQWPLPTIRVTKGDTLQVQYNNLLGNQSSSLHWHGIYQNGTTHMDGPVAVSQCAIPPGGSFFYNFTVCSTIARCRPQLTAFPD